MSKVRGGLGRGLGALIPSVPPPPPAPAVPAEVTVPAARDGAVPVSAPPAPGFEAWRDGLAPVPGARYAEVPVDGIVPNPRQPRTVFDEESLEELKSSVEQVGFLQPIVVRETGPHRYEIVMGERRWRPPRSSGAR